MFFERNRPPPYRQRAIVEGRYKLVVIEESAKDRSEASPEALRGTVNLHPGIYLYDLTADPGETTNLYSEGDERARDLLAKLEAHFAGAAPASTPVGIDAEQAEKLRKLGYAQ